MSNPLVSVVVPVYNAAPYLRECLDSILGQSYHPIEVIVTDDASTDGSAEISTSYGRSVRAQRQARNVGQSANVNSGIALATGDLIAVYHADDVYIPTIVASEVEFLMRQRRAAAVFALDVFIDADGREYGKLILPDELRGGGVLDYEAVVNLLLTHRNTFLRTPSAMVRAEVYRRVGGYVEDGRYANASDLEMWLRIARRNPIGVLDRYLFKYRHFHGNSMQRFHHLRTQPGGFFLVMDEHLEAGGAAVATPRALVEYEAHRAQDALFRALNHYIRRDLRAARAILLRVSARTLMKGHRIQRWRLLTLWAGLHVLCRLPRSTLLARSFYRRWHVKAAPGGS